MLFLVCGADIKIWSAGELVNNKNLVFNSIGCEVHDQGANRLVSCDVCVPINSGFCGTTWKRLWVSLRPRFCKGTNPTPQALPPHLPTSQSPLSYSTPLRWGTLGEGSPEMYLFRPQSLAVPCRIQKMQSRPGWTSQSCWAHFKHPHVLKGCLLPANSTCFLLKDSCSRVKSTCC